jgi:hypothetical protein
MQKITNPILRAVAHSHGVILLRRRDSGLLPLGNGSESEREKAGMFVTHRHFKGGYRGKLGQHRGSHRAHD